MKQMAEIREVSVEVILDLRQRVLRPGLPREAARFEGDADPGAVHLAAMDETDRVVGCVTLLPNARVGDAWQLRGMAVDEDRRGTGMGLALLREAERRAGGQGLWCNARLTAAPFYARHGWQPVGPVFDIPTIGPHQRMRRPT